MAKAAVLTAQQHPFETTNNLTAAELRYQQSTHALSLLYKEEEVRKMKVTNIMLGDDVDCLNEQLLDEAERGDAAEAQAQNWREEAVDATDRLERTLNELRARTRELETLKAELLAMHDASADSTKLLTEKLALSREVATLKPELEHLRSQNASNDNLLSEKLELQRQLDAKEAELSSEKRTLKRVMDKQGAKSEQDAEREAEIEELKTELSKEKRERQKAEKNASRSAAEQLDELRKELAKEKKAREKAETAAHEDADGKLKELRKELMKEKKAREEAETAAHEDADGRIEQLQKELAKEKKARERAETAAHEDADGKLKELRKELAKERKEREKEIKRSGQDNNEAMAELRAELETARQEKARAENAMRESSERHEELKAELATLRQDHDKHARATSKANNTQVEELKRELAREKDEREALNEKLNLFRDKLRTTKEKLKQTEGDLVKAQEIAHAQSPHVAAKALKNPRKRPAVQIDPDAAIGTPGNAGPAKRSKRAPSVVGEKSNFSITPFLNRTTSVAADSPPKDDQNQDEPIASIEAVSPTAAKASRPAQKKSSAAVLAPSSPNKKIVPKVPAARKKVAAPITLNTVAEEGSDDENAPAPNQISTKAAAPVPALKAKPTLKPRKSLASFPLFRDSSLPPQPLVVQNKKKRKLLGNSFGAKTIFDEDEEDDGSSQPVFGGARAVSGQRAFGGFGKLGGGFGSLAKAKGPLMVAKDGFMFSPLKKDRKAMAAAAAGGA